MKTRSEEELKRLIAGVKREITRLGDMRPGHRFRELCDELVGLSVEASRARTAERIRKEEEDA